MEKWILVKIEVDESGEFCGICPPEKGRTTNRNNCPVSPYVLTGISRSYSCKASELPLDVAIIDKIIDTQKYYKKYDAIGEEQEEEVDKEIKALEQLKQILEG